MTQTDRVLLGERLFYKDLVLDNMSQIGNVAQFVSFDTGLVQRYCRVKGYPDNHKFSSLKESVSRIFDASSARSLNVRSFDPRTPESREFLYGLTGIDQILGELKRLSREGLHTIVNETIDIEDGGVSGVQLGNVIEFAPEDTPRCVEKPGVASLSREFALRLFKIVYGFSPELDYAATERVEFSLHPLRQGVRDHHTLVWQIEDVGKTTQAASFAWPNRFSRFIGDKAFGLLVAHLLGLPVPHTMVIPRKLAPFSFGENTGSAERWIRTCPVEQVPGKFTTERGWIDPFVLLAREDPEGTEIASVLSQEGVDARFSGAAATDANGAPIIEGVEGWGEDFMLGKDSPQILTDTVTRAVRSLFDRAFTILGPIRMEWASDGERVWVVQFHKGAVQSHGMTIVPGDPEHFLDFHVSEGIDALRELTQKLQGSRKGINLVGNVGLTSHFGDILRRSQIPSRIVN